MRRAILLLLLILIIPFSEAIITDPGGNLLISSDTYEVDDNIVIRILTNITSLTVIHGKDRFRFIGTTGGSIAFVPRDEGIYIVEALTKNNTYVNISFTVGGQPVTQANVTYIPPIMNSSTQTITYDKSIVSVRDSRGIDRQTNVVLRHFDDSVVTNNQARLDGTYKLDVIVQNSSVKRILFNNANVATPPVIGIEDNINPLLHPIDTRIPVNVYAIDPTDVVFTDGIVTAEAVGSHVWKCTLWNFTTQICNGNWTYFMAVTPGEDYSFTINSTDPAFAETFDTNEAVDVGIVALDQTTLVMTWIDAGTSDASFEIWDTDGTLLIDEVDMDTTVDLVSRTSIDLINSTHFVIGVLDGPDDDYDFYIYNRSGNQLNVQEVDANAGANTDTAICQIGNEFGIIWADDVSNDAELEIWDNSGNQVRNEWLADNNMAPGATLQNYVDCAAVNSTHWVYIRNDDASNDATVRWFLNDGSARGSNVDLDTNIGTIGQVAITQIGNDQFAYVYYDAASDDITIGIRQPNGATFTTILANTDIDTNAGTVSRVDITEVNVSGASNFAVGWQDTSDGTIKAAVYTAAGVEVTSPFVITTTPDPTYNLLSMAGFNSLLGTGMCNGTFAIAYTNNTNTAMFETYNIDGTFWDGICDMEPPVVILNNPPDATTVESATIDFNFTVTDNREDPITNCTVYTNATGTLVPNTTRTNVPAGTEENITVAGHVDGVYLWNVECVDIKNNVALASSNFVVNANPTPPALNDEAINDTEINQSLPVEFNISIVDSFGIDTALVELIFPNSTYVNYSLTPNGDEYSIVFPDTNQSGVYTARMAWANDTLGQMNSILFTLQFTVTTSQPGVFDLLTPTDNTVSGVLIPTFSWEATVEDFFSNYTLLLDKDSDFSSPDYTYYNTSVVTNNSREVDFAVDANTIYYWRIIAYDQFGNGRNSTSDFAYITDKRAPNVVLNTPADGGAVASSTPTFTLTAYDNNTIQDCTLYFNTTGAFVADTVNTTPGNDVPTYITSSSFADGEHYWTVACDDTSGNTNTSFYIQNRSVIIDTTGPIVNLTRPVNNTLNDTTNNIIFYGNTTDALSGVTSCDLLIDGVVEKSVTPITEGIEFSTTEFLSNGMYNWSYQCTDDVGNIGTSIEFNISLLVIDANPPLVTLNYPLDNRHVSTNNISFNYTPEDASGYWNCSIFVDGVRNMTNATPIDNFVPNYFNISNFTETVHNWSVECVDNSTENNTGVSFTYDFTVDLTKPIVTLYRPFDTSFTNDEDVTFNYTPVDTYLNNCTLYGDFSGSWTSFDVNTTPTSEAYNYFDRTLNDGTYLWNVYCQDNASNNQFAGANFTINVDTTSPNYTNIDVYPVSPVVYVAGTFYEFNITWVDNFGLDTVLIEHDFSGILLNESLDDIGNDVYEFNVTGLAAGTYSYRWYGNDSQDNTNKTQQFSYTVGQASTSIDFRINGTDGDYVTDEYTFVNFTALLGLPTGGFVEIYENGTLIDSGSANFTNISFRSLAGLYNITTIFPATVNETTSRETHFLTVNDITPPIITLIFPENDTFVGTTGVVFQFNVSDSSQLENCSLFINETYNQTRYDVQTNALETFSATLINGNYSYRVECNDSVGNFNMSHEFNFTLIDSSEIQVDISATNITTERGLNVTIGTNTTDIFGSLLQTNVTTDIIIGNTSFPWWNPDWKQRIPILITDDISTERTNFPINVSVTGLGGNITTCANEIRVVELVNYSLIPYELVNGDDDTYCTILFIGNVSQDAVNEEKYHVYFNNSAAINPGYPEQDYSIVLMSEDFGDSGGGDGWADSTGTNCGPVFCTDNSPWGNFDLCTGTDYEMCTTDDGADLNHNAADYALRMQDMDGTPSPEEGLIANFTSTDALCNGYWCSELTVEFDFTAASLDNPAEYCTTWINDSDSSYLQIFTCTTGNASCALNDTTPEPADYTLVGPIDACSLADVDCTQDGNEISFHLGGVAPGNGDHCMYDNFIVKGHTRPSQNLTVSLDTIYTHYHRETSKSTVGGVMEFDWDTHGLATGNYSAVSNAGRGNFTNNTDYVVFEILPDTTPPNVTLVAPPDFQEGGVGDYDFEYQVTDPNLDNCTLYIDLGLGWGPNVSNTTPLNNHISNTFLDVSVGFGLNDWNIGCYDIEGNLGFAEENFTLNITGPDLKINSSDIWFSLGSVEGENITIFVNVTNIGLTNAIEEFNVSFWYGDPLSGGTQINGNRSVAGLAIGVTTTENVSFLLEAGTNHFWVTVDPNDQVNETTVLNNNDTNNITVPFYHIFYGNITAGIHLDTSINESFYLFGDIFNKQGYVLVTDTDSSFLFTNLRALTRTAGDAPTANDFSETDTNFGSTAFNDSIYEIWGGGSNTPLQTMDVVIAEQTINNVPYVNSTNSGTFVTGILWDFGDDSGDTQYSTSDNEDLIFVSNINQSQVGLYGTYDYEVAIPSKLQSYKPSEDELEFYYEIQ